ncbi:MAG: prepilin-type N-terminal cleavage/methylation domain-containing protein [Myxococcota bacterium]
MRRVQQGFSLVELMIVVSIIGILAAIAIPNFLMMQSKAKRAELPANVDGIKTAELGYHAEFDEYLALTTSPTGTPAKAQTTWTANGTEWTRLGWSPDGEVRGQYGATLVQCDQDPTTYAADVPVFCVTGASDVDADSNRVVYYAGPLYNPTVKLGSEAVY